MSIAIPTQLIKKARMSSTVLFLVLLIFCGLSVPGLLEYYSYDKEDWKSVAKYLKSKSQPNDVIIIQPPHTKINLLYYYDANLKNNTVISKFDSFTKLEDISRRNRVWYVYVERYWTLFDKEGKIKYWLYKNSGWGIKFNGISVFFIFPQEYKWFKAAIFAYSKATNQFIQWTGLLNAMGASTSQYNETTDISSVNMSEFNVVVFADFKRSLDDVERLHINEFIQNGLIVIVSGLSPYYLAGGTKDLAQISSWFGATIFSEAPKETRWKVKFTEKAREIMKELVVDREYAFYIDFDWSTPTGCLVQPESVVYAYRVNDQAVAVFSYKFGKGISIFNGARCGFESPDADAFQTFIQALIHSALGERSR